MPTHESRQIRRVFSLSWAVLALAIVGGEPARSQTSGASRETPRLASQTIGSQQEEKPHVAPEKKDRDSVSNPSRAHLLMVTIPSSDTYLRMGEQAEIAFKVRYSDVPPGSDLYVLLSPMQGDSLVLEKGYYFSGSASYLSFCTKFVLEEGDSTFGISRGNYPISASFKGEELEEALYKTLPSDEAAKFASFIEGKSFKFTFGFVAPLGAEGEGLAEGTVTFTPPDLGEDYDGVLITPWVFTFDEDRDRCAYYGGKGMHTARFPVAPSQALTASEGLGETVTEESRQFSITSYSPDTATIGRKVDLTVQMEYRELAPGAQIYLLLQAMDGRQMLNAREDEMLRTHGVRLTVCEDTEINDGIFNLPQDTRPIYATTPELGQLEAAFLADLSAGGSGQVSGLVRFTAPPLPTYYDGIRVTPLVFEREQGGMRCASYNAGTRSSILLPIEGRR